jgi:hypothetical protein
MVRLTPPLTLLAMGLVMALGVAPAQAQLARTFVSAASGNDGNDCNRATPCRTFQAAHDKTFDQGEITVLDPGGYGAVTITKSIAIVNDGVGEAGLLVSGGGTGIVINAPNAYVSLRGLTIQGIGFGLGHGIRLDKGYSLAISNCVVRNLTGGNGIEFFPASEARLAVANTLVADNGGSGIAVDPLGAGVLRVDFDRVQVHNNSVAGIFLDGTNATGSVTATIADSASAGNQTGINVLSAAGSAPVTAIVSRSVISNSSLNGLGVFGQGTRLVVGQSALSGNAKTWQTGGGVLQSFGDNYIAGNLDNDPAIPVILTK